MSRRFNSDFQPFKALSKIKQWIGQGSIFVLALVCTIPLAVSIQQLVYELEDQLNFTQQEIQGLEYIKSLKDLLQDLIKYKNSLTTTSLKTNINYQQIIEKDIQIINAIDNKVGNTLQTTKTWEIYQKEWEKVKYHLNDQSLDLLITNIPKQITHIGDTSNMILDPELDTYYFLEMLINKVPYIVENTKSAVEIMSNYLTDKSDKKMKLAVYKSAIEMTIGAIDRSRKVVINHSPNLRFKLDPAIDKTINSTNEFTKLIANSFLTKKNNVNYTNIGNQAITEQLKLYDTVAPITEGLLQSRVDMLNERIYRAITFSILVFGIIIYTLVTLGKKRRLENKYTKDLQNKTEELQIALVNLKKTQSQLIQIEKMSSLGQLVAGIAHEINNPVGFIYSNVTHVNEYMQNLVDLIILYRQYYPQPMDAINEATEDMDLDFVVEDLPNIISSIKTGAERIRQIVVSLRNFSRMDEADYKQVNIHEGINSTLMLLQYRLKAQPNRPAISIIKDYGDLPHVECYAGQLNQVFMHILNNAIDALELAVEKNQLTNPEIKIYTETSSTDRISIHIIDNGVGMTQETQQHLFDPFFTTKPIGKGIGMSLSISYQIITQRHIGTLECFSVFGQGAEFVITIPISQIII